MRKPHLKHKNPYLKRKIDQDGLWKSIITVLFQSFIEFFMNDLYYKIDFNAGVESLEQELAKLVPEYSGKGKKRNDKLLKVKLKSGEIQLLYIHVEVQSSVDKNFAKRMFTYYYRVVDHFGLNVDSIAIYTSKSKRFAPDRFEHNTFGTSIVYKFRSYNVYAQSKEDLKMNPNPFSLVVLAQILMLETQTTPEVERLQYKEELTRLLLERKYELLFIEALLVFIDNIMALSPELEKIFKDDLSTIIKKEKPMELTLQNSPLKEVFQQAFYEMGVEKGISQGEIKGKLEGKLIANAKVAIKMLKAQKDISEVIEFTELAERDVNILSAYYNQFGDSAMEHLRFDGKQIDIL